MVRPASSDKCFFITVIPTRSICYSATTRTGHLEEDHPVTRFMKTKDSQVFFLQTDQFKVDRLQIIVVAKKYIYVCVQFHNWFIHEFEGCFLRGQVSSNGFKVFNPVFQQLHSWTLNFIGQFGKKTWESFVFKKLCKWIIFFQVPPFEWSHCKCWWSSEREEARFAECSRLLWKRILLKNFTS